jgi:hypothetical protein
MPSPMIPHALRAFLLRELGIDIYEWADDEDLRF